MPPIVVVILLIVVVLATFYQGLVRSAETDGKGGAGWVLAFMVSGAMLLLYLAVQLT